MRNASDKWLATLSGHQIKTWRLLEYIGHGRVGVVYKAESTQVLGWIVAVKIFFHSPRPGWQTELQKVSKLALVPGVVPFHNLDSDTIIVGQESKHITFTVWEFIPPGRNLKTYLATLDACPPSFLVAVMATILRVLHACKARGIAQHGDLHAGNILIGESDEADLNPDTLKPRTPLFLADFGYGATGALKQPKDDYLGLADIANSVLFKVDRTSASASDRRIIAGVEALIGKALSEKALTERATPLELLQFLHETEKRSVGSFALGVYDLAGTGSAGALSDAEQIKVGQFQIAEMLGDNWALWRRLFVPSIPARSRVLEPDITTLVTGPRGCGKTMLFRRLSERLLLECGPVSENEPTPRFVGFYINANDVADAFPAFRAPLEADLLICYANLCFLSDVVAVESTRCRLMQSSPASDLLLQLRRWTVGEGGSPVFMNEDELERYRHELERIKWQFSHHPNRVSFAGKAELSRHDWIRRAVHILRNSCPWIGNRHVLLFVDDYSTPRVSEDMQKVLNRLLFQRSSELCASLRPRRLPHSYRRTPAIRSFRKETISS